MNKISKRGLSLMLALIMCLSLLAGINFSVFAATGSVTYRYDGSYVYNWGTREVEATFLSPMAEDYYESKNTSYAELAALSGSTSQSGAGSSALYYELQEIMSSGAKSNSYNDNKNLAKYTDCQNNGNWNSGKISSFYSGTAIGPGWNSSEWNREHTWPNSKGGSACENIFMIRPTSISENSSRGNTAYGKSGSYYNPNSESGGKYDLRGDVARLVLGVWVMYGSNSTIKNKMWGTSGVMESKEVLLEWIAADPVDTWELGRNDSVESILNFRNVFVDYPELAYELFEADIPANIKTPSGIGASGSVSYTVKASASHAFYGTVNVSGNTITATPVTGYEVTGYTIVSGQATVTRNGNVFTVKPSSDCEIKINFAKRTEKQASFYGNGVLLSSTTGYNGDQITMPAYTGQVPQDWTFAGWITKEVEETTDKQTFVAAGAKYTLSDNVKFYALFSRTENGGTGTANTFTKYTGALTEGDYILTYDGEAMKAAVSSSRLAIGYITITNNTIENPAADIIWHISFTGNDKVTIYNKATNMYAAGTGVKNKAQLLASGTDAKSLWLYSGSSTYEFTNVNNMNANVNALLHKNGTYGFACYSSGTGGALTLYKGVTSTTYYTTNGAVEIPPEDVAIEHTYEKNGVEVTDAYDSLEEALLVATDGVVTLQSDVSAGTVVVKPNVTLDLNGYTLYADALIAMNGAIVCDGGAACAGGGLLSVPQGNLALAKENGDGIVAVWNGVDGYIFTKVTFQQTTASAAAGKARYIFLPSFSNEDATALFADGALDNELSVKVCLSWNDGYSQQFYTYSDDLVKRVYDGTGSLAFDLTVTGMAGIADMVASPVVVTASGAQATTFGTALTAN